MFKLRFYYVACGPLLFIIKGLPLAISQMNLISLTHGTFAKMGTHIRIISGSVQGYVYLVCTPLFIYIATAMVISRRVVTL